MKYDVSYTKTEYLLSQVEAPTPEEARTAVHNLHPEATVEVHSVQEVPESFPVGDYHLVVSGNEVTVLGWSEVKVVPKERFNWLLEEMLREEEAPKIVMEGDSVYLTGEVCPSCGGGMATNGDHDWCTKCAKLVEV